MPKVMTIGSLKIKDTLPAGSFEPPLGKLAGLKGVAKRQRCCLIDKKTGRTVKCGAKSALKKRKSKKYVLRCGSRSSGIGMVTIEGRPRGSKRK